MIKIEHSSQYSPFGGIHLIHEQLCFKKFRSSLTNNLANASPMQYTGIRICFWDTVILFYAVAIVPRM